MFLKSTEESFSLPNNELFLKEKSFEECRKKRQEKYERLQYIKREIEELSKELGNLKREISSFIYVVSPSSCLLFLRS